MVGAKKSSSGCCLGFSLWSQMWSGRSPRSPYIFIGAVVLWSYSSWIYNYMYLLRNQCLSPLMLWGRISIMARCTTLCDKVCQWLATGRWFSPSPPVSSTNKTDCHDITEILLRVALSTINQTTKRVSYCLVCPSTYGFWLLFWYFMTFLISYFKTRLWLILAWMWHDCWPLYLT